jgi:beta-glucosidase
MWDDMANSWSFVKGWYDIQVGRSIADRRLATTVNV